MTYLRDLTQNKPVMHDICRESLRVLNGDLDSLKCWPNPYWSRDKMMDVGRKRKATVRFPYLNEEFMAVTS